MRDMAQHAQRQPENEVGDGLGISGGSIYDDDPPLCGFLRVDIDRTPPNTADHAQRREAVEHHIVN